ncbi:MAG: dihydrodipicolinate synthase family protein [Candidatus Nanopelagicaceae bacterium]
MNRGVYPVIQTPLDENDEIDEVVFETEINWLIKCGVKGLVLAMVSEVMRFSAAERRKQWQIVLRILDGRLPLIVSVGGESTAIAVQLAKAAESDGATALIATPPASFPATSSEIHSYYTAIIEAVKIPLIVQDASNYMGQPLELELYGKLLEKYGNTRVQFKPEAKPVRERMAALQEIAGGKAKVYEGQSGLDLLDTHPLGLVGTMPGAEIPWAIVALWEALEAKDFSRATAIHACVKKLVAFQPTIDAYVAVEKYLLVKQGIFTSSRQHGPVSTILSDQTKNEIDLVFNELLKVVGS